MEQTSLEEAVGAEDVVEGLEGLEAMRLGSNEEATTSAAAPPKPRVVLPTRQQRQAKQQKWLESRGVKKAPEQPDRPAEPRTPPVATLKHRLLNGPKFAVTCVAFSPDGDLLATASRDVRIYDTRTGALKVILDGHGGLVRSVGFTPDGRLLCSGGDDCTALVWSLEHCFSMCTPGTIATLTPPGGPSSTNLPTNDPTQFVGAGSGRSPHQHGGASSTYPGGASAPENKKLSVSVLGLSLGIPGSTVGSGGGSSATTSYSPMSRIVQRALKRHHKPVLCLATTPDSKYLVTGSSDKTVRVWDVCTGYIMATLRGHTGEITCVAVTPNGRRIVSSGTDRTINVWDFVTGELKRALKGHKGAVSCMAVAPDGHYLVTGSHDKTIRVWDLINGNELATLPAHSGAFGVLSVAVSPDGTTIMSGGYDNLAKLWDAGSGLVSATLQGHRHMISSVAFSSDCSLLATAGRDDEVRLWSWAHERAVTDPGGPAAAAIGNSTGGSAAAGSGRGSRGGDGSGRNKGDQMRSSQEEAVNSRHWAYLVGEQGGRDGDGEEHPLQAAGLSLRPMMALSRATSFAARAM